MEEKKKEYPVGQVFKTYDGIDVICVEDDNDDDMNSCGSCIFVNGRAECPLCSSCLRSDRKNVIFKALVEPSKLKEEEPKTYFEVGEEFQMGLVRLRCEEEEENEGVVRADELCLKCFFRNIHCDSVRGCIGNCFGEDRPDGKDVVFVELK